MLVFEFNVTVRGLAVVPLDHPLKLYPEVGVAVTLTCVPALKLPVVGDTLPPLQQMQLKCIAWNYITWVVYLVPESPP